jgi:beta propeller repeat protein
VRQITTDPAGQFDPQILGNLIVYRDNRNDTNNLYYFDLATGTEHPLLMNSGETLQPSILPAGLAWTQNRASELGPPQLRIFWNPSVRPTF